MRDAAERLRDILEAIAAINRYRLGYCLGCRDP